MKINVCFFWLVIILFSSCATIINSPVEKISFLSKKSCRVVVNNDTINTEKNNNTYVLRNKAPLKLTVIEKDTVREVRIKSSNSFAFYLNAYPQPLFIVGFIIDLNNNKRFNYPRAIYLDANKKDGYTKYILADSAKLKRPNIVKATPLKLIGLVNPAIEVSYERYHGNYFSSQLSWSFLNHPFKPLNLKPAGYRISIEERFYFNNPVSKRIYLAFEVDHLKRDFRATTEFSKTGDVRDTSNVSYDDEFGVHHTQWAFTPKIGFQYYISKRIVLDGYVGLGLQKRKVTHTERLIKEDKLVYWHPNIPDYILKETNGWRINLPLNIKVGWVF